MRSSWASARRLLCLTERHGFNPSLTHRAPARRETDLGGVTEEERDYFRISAELSDDYEWRPRVFGPRERRVAEVRAEVASHAYCLSHGYGDGSDAEYAYLYVTLVAEKLARRALTCRSSTFSLKLDWLRELAKFGIAADVVAALAVAAVESEESDWVDDQIDERGPPPLRTIAVVISRHAPPMPVTRGAMSRRVPDREALAAA